jgi:TPR repeat protein
MKVVRYNYARTFTRLVDWPAAAALRFKPWKSSDFGKISLTTRNSKIAEIMGRPRSMRLYAQKPFLCFLRSLRLNQFGCVSTALSLCIFLSVISPLGMAAAGDDFEFRQLQSQAAQGDAKAEFLLGRAYSQGEGVARDDAKAAEWYRKAAEQGNAKAQNNLAGIYLNGIGVPRDEAEAVKWYRKAADQGAAWAQDTLGQLLARGIGVPKDNKQAAEWYRKAAEQGLVKAQVDLGELYYFGAEGVPQNQAEAAIWIAKAAAQGDAWAQNTLGVMDEYGFGVKKDPKQAAGWYLKAAEQGDAKAQSNLGKVYADGTGGEQSWAKAYAWLSLSAAGGEVTARKLLDSDQGYISAEAAAEGKRLADEYRRQIENNKAAITAQP